MHQIDVGVTLRVTSVWLGGSFPNALYQISCIKVVQDKSNDGRK